MSSSPRKRGENYLFNQRRQNCVKRSCFDHIVEIDAVENGVGGGFIARAEADCGDARFTSSVDAVGREFPFTSGGFGETD